jgi:hypothetical protein
VRVVHEIVNELAGQLDSNTYLCYLTIVNANIFTRSVQMDDVLALF